MQGIFFFTRIQQYSYYSSLIATVDTVIRNSIVTICIFVLFAILDYQLFGFSRRPRIIINSFSNSLIIGQVKTKNFGTVTVIWICHLNDLILPCCPLEPCDETLESFSSHFKTPHSSNVSYYASYFQSSSRYLEM